jgi:putative aldouronate transport system substrate-binding protein
MKRIGLLGMMVMCGAVLWAGGSAASSGSSSSNALSGNTVVTPGAITLDYWLPININAIKFMKSYAECEPYQEIQRRLKININFIHPANGSEQEQFNLVMASGDLPDMIQGANRYSGGVMKGVADGVYVELSSYLQRQAPDYYKAINESRDMRRQFYDEAGHIGAFYKISPTPPAPYHNRAITRKDWLDEFGMKPPMTFDQYEAFFKAVLEKKPGVVPLYLPVIGGARNEPYYAFNLVPDWFVSSGKVRHAYGDPELLKYVTKMNDWYKKGYISKDFPSISEQQIWSLFDTGKVAMYWDSVDSSGARTANLPFEIENCPFMRETENTKLHYQGPSPYRRSGDETSITTKASRTELEAALKFLNYGYTEEGAMLYNWGIEGKSYTLVNKKPVYTDLVMNNPNFTTENANYIMRIHFAPKLGISDTVANPTVIKNEKSLAFRNQWKDDPNVDGSYRMPPIALTPEENTRRAEIMANVNTYASEMILKFIIGTEPLSNFNNYLNQINSYGFQEAIKLTQAAYDRYMAK